MAKDTSKIVAATGIAVAGNSTDSKAKEVAMRSAAIASHVADHDGDRIAEAVRNARKSA